MASRTLGIVYYFGVTDPSAIFNEALLALEASRKPCRGKVGVFGIGLAAYWPQFAGLKERLEGYQREVEAAIAAFGVEVVSAGLVDTPEGAAAAGARFAAADLDLIVCYVGTYATSSQVLPVVQRSKLPVVVLNLQPSASLDYETTDTGEWLANCSTCCVPEISNAFARARVKFRVVSGTLRDDPAAWGEIADWCRATRAVHALRSSRIGFLGHTYPGMLDMYSDFTMVQAQTGAHVEVLEMCDLDQCVEAVPESEVTDRLALATADLRARERRRRRVWPGPRAWRPAWTGWPRKFDLDGLTYYYRGLDGNRYERLGAGLILGNSLLTARGIPASGEGDLKTCLAMMILDRLGAGGSFTEFYAMDLRRGLRADGPRRPRPPGHLRPEADLARARPVPRQARPRRLGRVQSPHRAGDHPGRHADRRRLAQDAGGGRRIAPRPDSGDRQHQLAAAIRAAAGGLRERLVRARPHPPLRARRGPSGRRAGQGGIASGPAVCPRAVTAGRFRAAAGSTRLTMELCNGRVFEDVSIGV